LLTLASEGVAIGPLIGKDSFSIRRSTRARRSRLTITAEGEAVVVLPMRAPESHAYELVNRHRRWVAIHQKRIRAQLAARSERPSLDRGRAILFHGEPHRVVSIAAIDGRRSATVEVLDGRLVVTSPALDRRSTAELLERWFRSEARREIESRVALRSREMALPAKHITIRDQKTRWGSASRSGTLSFSWRLVMCPASVLDYVVVHELAHLKVSGHGHRFWRLVERHFTDPKAARKWLRDHHDDVRHALD
jgi:predicted metal-dependent hydrolase